MNFNWDDRISALRGLLGECTLCPRECRANRLAGETGFCGFGTEMAFSRALPHFGEEPPISGSCGAGTVFFSGCNLKCVYCQNWQISLAAGPGSSGRNITPHELADIFIKLGEKGCHNVEAVTPTPHIPGFVEALHLARDKGLDLPVVFNCSGYENPDIVELLDGIVDIWLPDFKYASEKAAAGLSAAPDYPGRAIAAIREMVSRAGDELITSDETAVRGVIIRHLILPGMTENSIAALELIRKEVPTSVPISLMGQYTPVPAMHSHSTLNRRVSGREYGMVLEAALDLGFDTIFTQEIDERDIAPDFDRETPFQWLWNPDS